MKNEEKELILNTLLDAFGVIIIFLGGYIATISHIWYNPFISILCMIVGYFLIKGKIEYIEEKGEKKE